MKIINRKYCYHINILTTCIRKYLATLKIIYIQKQKLVIFLAIVWAIIHIHMLICIHDKSRIYYYNQLLAQQFIRCWILQINRQLSDVVSETDARAEDVMHDHLSKGIKLSL